MTLTPAEIQRLSKELPAASPEAAAEIQRQLGEEEGLPSARLQVRQALAAEGDPAFQRLFQAIIFNASSAIIRHAMATNRSFEQSVGRLALELMRQLGPPPRGRPKPKSA
jgi:hypothetical protein